MLNDDFIIKGLTIKNIDELYELETAVWKNMAASREELERRIRLTPDSTFGAYYDRRLVGSVTCVQVKFRGTMGKKWHEYITYFDLSEEEPDCVYIVSFSAHPEAPHGVGRSLLKFACGLCEQRNLKYLAYGSRIPGFKKYIGKLNVEEYVGEIKNKTIIDPVLSLAHVLKFNIGHIIKDYFSDDESDNHGVLVFREIKKQSTI